MILEIYITLTFISIILLILGYKLDGVLFKLLGYSFLFIINIVPLTDGGVQFHSGDTITQLSSGVTEIVKDYTLFDSFYFFFFLTVLGGFAVLWVAVEDLDFIRQFVRGDDD